jgi:hypothetical protein
MNPCSQVQVAKLPAEVQKERAQETIRANQIAKKEQQLLNDGKTRMKGKNVATKRHRKRQNNIIEVWCCRWRVLGSFALVWFRLPWHAPTHQKNGALLRHSFATANHDTRHHFLVISVVKFMETLQERTKKAAKNVQQEQAERKAKVQAELAEQRENVPRALWRLHQRGT